MEFAEETQMKRIDQLTFTRFIAILVVVLFHGGGGIYFQKLNFFPLSALLVSATTSVTYLYVLSGFVIALAHYRPNEEFSFETYWKARFVRLYPLYLIAFLLVCYYYIDFVARVKLPKTLANFFVLQAWFPDYSQSFNFPAWSITVEFFFYAVFPFFAYWAYRQSTKKLIWVSLILWIVTQTVHQTLWSLYYPESDNFLIYFPLFHLSSFVLGASAGIWFLREGREQKINPRMNLLILFGAVLLVCVYVIVSRRVPQLPHGEQLMTGLLAPFLTLVIIALALDKTRFSGFLSLPALILLGEISYALYILHIPVKWNYERVLENLNYQDLFGYTYLPLMIGIAFIAHFYVDQPIRNWLKKIMQNISFPLLILDLAILGVSIYISFRFRFGHGKEFSSYYTTALLMFWSALVLRTIFSGALNAFNPSILHGSFMQFVRPVIISVTLGSAVIAGIVYMGYSLAWFENFPRSVFVVDWVLVLGLSLAIRLLFRISRIYEPYPIPG